MKDSAILIRDNNSALFSYAFNSWWFINNVRKLISNTSNPFKRVLSRDKISQGKLQIPFPIILRNKFPKDGNIELKVFLAIFTSFSISIFLARINFLRPFIFWLKSEPATVRRV